MIDDKSISQDRRIQLAILKQQWAVADKRKALFGLEYLIQSIGYINNSNSNSFGGVGGSGVFFHNPYPSSQTRVGGVGGGGSHSTFNIPLLPLNGINTITSTTTSGSGKGIPIGVGGGNVNNYLDLGQGGVPRGPLGMGSPPPAHLGAGGPDLSGPGMNGGSGGGMPSMPMFKRNQSSHMSQADSIVYLDSLLTLGKSSTCQRLLLGRLTIYI
jgi:hypothetical protein